MNKLSLDASVRDQMARASSTPGGHSADTVYGGHEHALHQTIIALTAGSTQTEPENLGEATVYVLRGRVQLSAGEASSEGGPGDLLSVPQSRHVLRALEDSAVLLTVHPRRSSRDASVRDQMARASSTPGGRSADTVYGDHGPALRQTIIALNAGCRMEPENLGEATVYVLHGRVQLGAGDAPSEGRPGDLLIVPQSQPVLHALEDSAVLLTVHLRRSRVAAFQRIGISLLFILAVAYLIAVPLGLVPSENRLDTSGLVLGTVLLAGLIFLVQTTYGLRELTLGPTGFKAAFEQIKGRQSKLESVVDKLSEQVSKLFLGTMAPTMYGNLKKLADPDPKHEFYYEKSTGLQRELEHLRDIGYIYDLDIEKIPHKGPDLRHYAKVTPLGGEFIELRESSLR